MIKDGLFIKQKFEAFFETQITSQPTSLLRGVNEILVYYLRKCGFSSVETAYYLGYDTHIPTNTYLRVINKAEKQDPLLLSAYDVICEAAMNGETTFLEFANLYKKDNSRLGGVVNDLLRRHYRTKLSNVKKEKKANL